MESLICALHLPEPNEPSEQSPVQAHSARQWMSRAWPQLGSGPSPGISARYDSVRAEGSAHFAKPDQESQYKCWLGYVMRSSTSIQTRRYAPSLVPFTLFPCAIYHVSTCLTR